MLFNDAYFAIFMVVLILIIGNFRDKKKQLIMLLLASFIFYYFDVGLFLFILLFSSLLSFYCGKKIFESKEPAARRLFLILNIIGNMLVLGFFKYADFGIHIINQIASMFNIYELLNYIHIILPVGISFFTFQAISYTIDVYRGQIPSEYSFWKYALYMAFFPKLIAGPIVRAKEFLPQLETSIVISTENVKIGITYICIGLVKKIVFGDTIALFVDTLFSNPLGLTSFPIIMGALAFGIQIYCDFSGYTDFAIGCARIFGLKLPTNFDKPYFAQNPVEFWRKWNMTLSAWLRDYVYIPLGGNRKGVLRMYINTLVTMVVSGLWHGAAWNFVLWGIYHGILLVAYKAKICKEKIAFITRMFSERWKLIISIIITQYFIFLGWLIFRVGNIDYLKYVLKKFIILDFSLRMSGIFIFLLQNKVMIFLIFVFIYLHLISYKVKNIVEKISMLSVLYWFFFLIGIMLLLFLFAPSTTTPFIYTRF